MAGRPSHELSDYLELAESKDMELLSVQTPTSSKTPIKWRCKHCLRIVQKSFQTLLNGANACRCRASNALKERHYHQLASELGIIWVGEHLPQNAHEATLWLSFNSVKFTASYSDLSYKLKRRFEQYVQQT
jgi:hypothetical protein